MGDVVRRETSDGTWVEDTFEPAIFIPRLTGFGDLSGGLLLSSPYTGASRAEPAVRSTWSIRRSLSFRFHLRRPAVPFRLSTRYLPVIDTMAMLGVANAK